MWDEIAQVRQAGILFIFFRVSPVQFSIIIFASCACSFNHFISLLFHFVFSKQGHSHFSI